MDIKQLCIDIATKEDGNEVIEVLKNYNLWDDKNNWEISIYFELILFFLIKS